MTDDSQQLKSKYDRLCVEFKKLRTKYTILKDNENSQRQQLQEVILKKDLCIEKLEQEIHNLKSLTGQQQLSLSPQQRPSSSPATTTTTLSEGCTISSYEMKCTKDLNKLVTILNKSNKNSNDDSKELSSVESFHPIHTLHPPNDINSKSAEFHVNVKKKNCKLSGNQLISNEIVFNNSSVGNIQAVCVNIGVQTDSVYSILSPMITASSISASDTTHTIDESDSKISSIIFVDQVDNCKELQFENSSSTLIPDESLDSSYSLNNEIDCNHSSKQISSSSLNIYQNVINTQNRSDINNLASSISSVQTELPISYMMSTSSTPTHLLIDQYLKSSFQFNEKLLIEQFTNLLNNWINSMKINNENIYIIDKQKIDNILINRIIQLESQLCDVSLQFQLEHKRRLKEHQELETDEDSKHVENSTVDNCNEESVEIVNLRSTMMRRIRSAIEESLYFASRANLLQDELESLLPWILQLIDLNEKQQIEIRTLNEHNKYLQQQLDLTKTNTVKQVNEMAKYMVNLTDELQCLRQTVYMNHDIMHKTDEYISQSNDNQLKKNTLFSVLKR
ncbi:unnamed protein product [Heterobilharzia americana]|nr:unnamed protein product [Heterobilharzia americana]